MKKKTTRLAIYLNILILIFAVTINAQKAELKLEILNGHSGGGVLAVAVSIDGKFALTGSTDNTALLWDLDTGKQLRRFVGHEDAVSAVQFSKDGQFVLTASYDKTARLWETATGKEVRRFIGHSGKILSAAISADGNLVATAGEDKTARIWDLKTGKQLFQIEHAGRVNSIAFSPDSALLLTGGEDKIARLYRTSSGELVRQFVGHTEEITSVAYSPDGKQVLTGSRDETARSWNSERASETKRFELKGEIYSVVFTTNGSGLIFSGRNNNIYYLDINSGNEIGLYGSAPIAITPYGNQILSNSDKFSSQSTISVFDFKKNKKVQELKGKSGIVKNIAVSPSSQFVFTGSTFIINDWAGSGFRPGGSGIAGLWDLTKGQELEWWNKRRIKDGSSHDIATFEKKNNNPVMYKSVSYVPNENLSSFSNKAASVEVFSQVNEEAAFSPDGRLLAISAGDAQIWNIEKGERLLMLNERFNDFLTGKIIFSPDSQFLFMGISSPIGGGGYIPGGEPSSAFLKIWNAKTGDEVRQLAKFGDGITSVALSPSGNTIATASSSWIDENIRLWNTETGEVKQIIKDFLAPVLSVAFSPDGKTIAAASGGEVDMSKLGIGSAASANGVRLFDVETGKEIDGFGGELKSSANRFVGFKSVAYSPDKEGRYIAAGSFDGKVYLRDNETKTLRKFEGHTGSVNSVKFAKDASGNLLVVSGSSDSTTRIWNAATGEEICALVTFRDGNWAVVQTKTGRYDAPNGGEIDGIQWVYGTETIELKQLSAMYYTPNLLPRLLGYNTDPLPAVVPLSDVKLYPSVIEQKFDEKTGKLNVKLRARNGGIGKTEVYVKGKITDKSGNVTEAEKLVVADARDEKLKQNPNVPAGEIVNLSVDLPKESFVAGSENQIKVVTSNYLKEIGKGNIQSRGTEIVYLDQGKEDLQLPTLYAIVGGVSDYAGDGLKLRFAAKDAEDFSNALQLGAKRLFGVEKVNITTLSTERNAPQEQPTKENFKRAIEGIAKKAKPEDIFLIYLSGHGRNFGNRHGHLFLSDQRRTLDLENGFGNQLSNRRHLQRRTR